MDFVCRSRVPEVAFECYGVVAVERVVHEKGVIDGFLLDHIQGVAVLRGERTYDKGEEDG